MIVGISRIGLVLPGNDSLKGKRSVVRKLLDRVRARFHVSAAEVADHDDHKRAVLGFCTVGADGRKVEQVLSRLLDFVEDSGLGQVVSTETDVVDYADLVGELEVESYADKFGLSEEDLRLMRGGRGGAPSGDGAEDQPADSARRMRIRPGSLGFGSGGGEDEESS
jgi:uncharacterized protein